MDRLRVILHLGTEKTGSTSIQAFMHSNQQGLAVLGYAYYSTPNRSDARGLSAAALDFKSSDDFLRNAGIESIEEREAFRRSVVEDLATFFTFLPKSVHTVVISSEHFHSRLRFPAQIDWLVRSIDQFAKQIQALVYLRPQVDLAGSYYSTALKTGSFIDLQTFVAEGCTSDNHYYNYARFLELWGCRIGKENLCVRRFGRSYLFQGDLVSDFCEAVGLPSREAKVLQRPEKLNESLTPLGQRLLRILNITHYRVTDVSAESVCIIERLRNLVVRQFPGAGELMPAALALPLQSTFDHVNEKVRSAFFEESAALFEQVRVAPDDQEVLLQVTAWQLHTLEQVFEVTQYSKDPLALELLDGIAVQLRDFGLKIADKNPQYALGVLKLAQRIRPSGFRIRKGIEALEASAPKWLRHCYSLLRFAKACRAKILALYR